jgi:hypothetical protein
MMCFAYQLCDFPHILVLLTRPIKIENTADISYDFTDAFEAGSSGTQNIFYAGFPIYQDQDTVCSCSQDVGITIPTIIWNTGREKFGRTHIRKGK